MDLLTLVCIPLVTAIAVGVASSVRSGRQIALAGSFGTWLYSLGLYERVSVDEAGYQLVRDYSIIVSETWNIGFTLGVDGISIYLILLTALLIPLCLLIGWHSVQRFHKEYLICFLIMESQLLLVFSVMDLLLFYIAFESVLIPMYLIIGIWGARERKILAAYQFFLYTLVGSLLMLLGILWIYGVAGTTDYVVLSQLDFDETVQRWLWLAFFVSFATKVPMIPVHIWLPEAHVEAPTAGSVILAGILLKLGTYGMLRYSLVLFPQASIFFTPLIDTISVIGIIYASLTTIRQVDMKKVIAYSSVAHMNVVTLGLFTLTIQGLGGSVMLMLSHGLISSALFIGIGVLYDRYHTRLLPYYGGVAVVLPVFSVLFLFFTFANISFPGTASFVGELLILLSIMERNPLAALGATGGVILGAVYSIWLANRVLFGPASTFVQTTTGDYIDVTPREFAIITPLVIGTLMMGIYPDSYLHLINSSSTLVLECIYARA